MNKEEIFEGNKLIAKFLGYHIEIRHENIVVMLDNDSNWCCMISYGEGCSNETAEQAESYLWHNLCNSYYGRAGSFESNFSRLMPVIQKINELGCIIEINYSLVTTCRICYLGKNKSDKAINFYGDNNGGKDPIEVIWNCVVEFLKFYNEKKDENCNHNYGI